MGFLGRSITSDVQDAFDRRREEGYRRVDDPEVVYYREMIHAPLEAARG